MPSSVLTNRSSRGAAPVSSRTTRSTTSASAATSRASAASVEGLEVRAHRPDLGNRREDCVLDILGDLVSVLQGQIAGKLQVERHLHAAVDLEHDQVVDLADLRHRERGGEDSLARLSFGAPRLDVDDDIGSGSRARNASSTRSAAACP